MTKAVKHPCINCIYFKVCGERTRTAPCEGRKTKSEVKAEVKAMKQVRISENNFAPLDLVLAAAENGATVYYDNAIKCTLAANIGGWCTAVIAGTRTVIHGWAGEFTAR